MNRIAIMNRLFKIGGLIALLGLLSFQATAQTEKTRTIEKSFSGKTALWASHRYGKLVMKKSNDNQIKAVLTIRAAGKDQSEVERFLKEFEMNTSEAPDNKIDIQTGSYIESWNQVKVISTVKSTIKLRNGNIYNGISKFDMVLELYVPKLRYATLENKYEAIQVEEGTTNILIVKLYDGELDVAGNYEKLNLEMKYSDAKVSNFNTSETELYDSNIKFGNGNILNLKTKYSEVEIGTLQDLTIESYDDEFEISDVRGSVAITDKYSEFKLGNIGGDMKLNFYDSKVEFGNAANINIDESKYTEFEFQNVNSLSIEETYDDQFEINQVGVLTIADSKYTEFGIGTLEKSLSIKSHDDQINVRTVGSGFEGFTFDGKYTEVDLPIPSSVKYEIDAQTKYGSLDFPESELDKGIFKEKSEEITLQGKLKGAGSNAPKIKIVAHDCSIDLN